VVVLVGLFVGEIGKLCGVHISCFVFDAKTCDYALPIAYDKSDPIAMHLTLLWKDE
jgi:hypothetical protein